MREWLANKLDDYFEARRKRHVAVTCKCGAEYTIVDDDNDFDLPPHWCDLEAVEREDGEWRSNVRPGAWTEHRACADCGAELTLPIVIRESVVSVRWLALRMLGQMAVRRVVRFVGGA